MLGGERVKKVLKALTFLLVMTIPFTASAADVKVEKEVTTYESWNSNEGGEIIFTISNLTVNNGATYDYQLTYGDNTTSWYGVTSATSDGIVVNLDKDKADILSILSKSDEAYLNIRETSNGVETTILSSYKVDISMSLSRAYKVGHFQSGYHGIKAVYDVDKIYYQYKKVDNVELIQKYLEYLKGYNDNSNIYWGFYVDNLIDQLGIENEMPETGWNELVGTETTTQPTEDGLYYLWIKAPASNGNKELIGCVFSKRFSDIKVLEDQLQDIIDNQPVEDDTPVEDDAPVVEEQPNVEETVDNPATGLYVSMGILGMLILGSIGFVALRKKSYFNKI